MITAAEAALLARRVPGWEQAQVTALPSGSNNSTWLLAAGGRRAVLKAAFTPRAFPLNSRDDEARIQRAAYLAGLAPRVLYSDDAILVEAYLEGSAWTARDLASSANLERLGSVLRRLHALPATGRRFPLAEAARHYRGRLPAGIDTVRADRCLAIVAETAAATRNGPSCLCHNDLVAENLHDGAALRLLDWEYAADNDPLFDLAVVIAHHGLDGDAAEALLDAYAGPRRRDEAAILARFCEAYRALAWLWAAARP